jgi:hypothetical protein
VPNNGAVPDAEIAPDGTVHLVYVVGEDVFYAKSADEGRTFSPPLRANSEPKTAHPANMFRGPDVALGKDGRTHVIWYSNGYQRKLPKNQWGVRYGFIDANGKAFSQTTNLNHVPSDNYSLAADARGRVAIFWMTDGLFLHESLDNGVTFATPRRVTIADTCECCASRAAFLPDGTLLCVYRDKEKNERDMFVLLQPALSPDFTRSKLSVAPWQVNACPMTGTFVAPATSGLVAAWETKGQVYFARCDKAGRKIGSLEVAAGKRGGKWPIALAASDGTLLVTWKRGNAVEWQLFDSDDKPVGEVQSAPGKNPHRHAAIVTRNGEFRIFN